MSKCAWMNIGDDQDAEREAFESPRTALAEWMSGMQTLSDTDIERAVKHVKCDEAIPSCVKCLRANRICHYANSCLSVEETKFVIYTIPRGRGLQSDVSNENRRALSYFQSHIANQIGGPFRSELWSTIIPQMMQFDPIVRGAVFALSAFHEHYMESDTAHESTTDLALSQYTRSQRQVIELVSPDDNFDSILCACIIFSVCEGIRGEFEVATRHILAGMKIIAAKANSTRATLISSLQKDTLADVFLMLQNQAMESNTDELNIDLPRLQDHMDTMPVQFDTAEQALPYLHNLLNAVLELDWSANVHHENHQWVPSEVSPMLQSQYNAICARVASWKKAIISMEDHFETSNGVKQASFVLLNILSSALDIDLYVFVHGEVMYDEFTELNHQRLSLIERFLHLRSVPNTHSSTSSPEVVPILYEIATRTRNPELHQRAVQILRGSRRREGIWDGQMAAQLAEKVTRLKTQGAAVAELLRPRQKFIVTDIHLLSAQKCRIKYGFKTTKPGAFESFWLETIQPGQGVLQEQVLTLS